MKINRFYIRGFGKLENFDMELSKGINVIYGSNESGKSTAMAFIKAAFYGLKGGRAGKDGAASEVKRYKPWNSTKYGGYINFELNNGRGFRIDRDFEAGSCKIYDEDFNDISGLYFTGKEASPAFEKLIGVNESVFERTVYIKQLGTKIDTSSSKELIDRISNIRQSGWEDVSYKKACSALKEALKDQVGTDRSFTRPLDIINRRLQELSLLKMDYLEKQKSISGVKEKEQQLAAEIRILTDKDKLIENAINFYSLKERLKLQQEKADEIRFINDGIKQQQNSLNNTSKEKMALQKEAQQLGEQKNALQAQLGQSQELELQEELESLRKHVKVLDIVGIVALVCIIAIAWGAFILERLPSLVAAIPAVVLVGAAGFRFFKGKEAAELEEEFLELINSKEQLGKQLEEAKRLEGLLTTQLIGLIEMENAEKARHEQQLKRFESISTGFSTSALRELENSVDSASEAFAAAMEQLSVALSPIEAALLEGVLEGNNNSSYQELKGLKQHYSEELQHRIAEKAALDYQLKQSVQSYDAEAVEQELSKLAQKKQELEQRGEALNIAMKTLEEASVEVQKKYLPVMNRVFSSTFSGLTDRKYRDTRAGDDLNIMLNDTDSETVIPVSSLSNGAVDQLYLSLRLAISETVLNLTEDLPLIMDEPFAQYDDSRTKNALRCIGELSRRQQVLIFTCKQREVEVIQSLLGEGVCKICSLT